MIFCPITESKQCITNGCVAYQGDSKPALCKCEICGQEFTMGGSCDQVNHNRIPRVIKRYPYCKHFKVDLKEST